MAEYDGLSQFRKVGIQRLRDAEQLLQPPTIEPEQSDANTRHLRGAVYLAGYSIECVLKEYIITHTPPARTLTEALNIREANGLSTISINSAAGHNLAVLLSMTELGTSIAANHKMREAWLTCLKWKATWRYDPTPPPREFADDFVAATRNVYQWIRQRV